MGRPYQDICIQSYLGWRGSVTGLLGAEWGPAAGTVEAHSRSLLAPTSCPEVE